ncbi:hypothetical protein G6F24_017736 [Rhizopus arrhizus]|nr:hypothetical protein G6F24_017736 [Rhizopus arrhizus]
MRPYNKGSTDRVQTHAPSSEPASLASVRNRRIADGFRQPMVKPSRLQQRGSPGFVHGVLAGAHADPGDRGGGRVLWRGCGALRVVLVAAGPDRRTWRGSHPDRAGQRP